MEAKLLEIRDEGTHIPALAVRLARSDGYPVRRAGFGGDPFVVLYNLATDEAHCDSNLWTFGRTMRIAHQYLVEHWNLVGHDEVLDVRYVIGETIRPVESER